VRPCKFSVRQLNTLRVSILTDSFHISILLVVWEMLAWCALLPDAREQNQHLVREACMYVNGGLAETVATASVCTQVRQLPDWIVYDRFVPDNL